MKINLLRNLFDNKFWRYSGQKDQLNDVPLFNNYIFKPAESYRFWDSITERDFARRFLYRTEEEGAKRDQIRSFFSDILKYQNRERLAFKITGPSRLGYLNSIFTDATFVFIKRRPLPNIRSMLKIGFYQDRKFELWWQGEDIYSAKEQKMVDQWRANNVPAYIAALQYYKIHEVFKKEKNALSADGNIWEVSFEDFIENPRDIISYILNMVDLTWDKNIEKYFANNTIFNRDRSKEYYISPDLDDKVLEIAVNGLV